MKLNKRAFEGKEDFYRIRRFLQETFILNNRHEYNWQVLRFDYLYYHGCKNLIQKGFDTMVAIWEDENEKIIACLFNEGKNDFHPQIHPHFSSEGLENEILEEAERRFQLYNPDENRKIHYWANPVDTLRCTILKQNGYEEDEKEEEHQNILFLDQPIPTPKIPQGYKIRGMHGEKDYPSRSWASWRAFHPDNKPQEYQGYEWYKNIVIAPLYRRELDLVVEAQNGEIVGFATIHFDEILQTGTFEPVGVVPEHQRKGLASALLQTGLHMMKALNIKTAHVGSGREHAHATYESNGFIVHDKLKLWTKITTKE